MNPKERRRAQYPDNSYGASNGLDSNAEHPFLTPRGLRLQMQGSRVDSVVPMSMPEYQVLPNESLPVELIQNIDPFDFDHGNSDPVINLLPSAKFPRPESLSARPLTPYFQTQLVDQRQSPSLLAIGRLFIQYHADPRYELASGSAWITGRNTIATCAHNVYDFTNKLWSRALQFHAGYDYYSPRPEWVCRVKRCYIPRGYLANPAVNDDIAICEVDRDIADIVGASIPIRPVEKNDFFDRNAIAIVGYPASSAFDFGNQMWQSVGDYLFGQNAGGDTDYAPAMATSFGGGASGCPWLVKEPFTGEYVAVGVTSGHAKLRYRRGESNLMSLVSPFFGPRLMQRLETERVHHDFV